ncbi:MAG: ATP-binding protein [Bryobacterales bacterium]|nr:ATP-binding protein [Bryobacterales bacterium]
MIVRRLPLAVLLWSVPVCALDPAVSISQYARRHWQVEDGLPQNYVTWISQSPDGYLLVGTAGGAARFDGLRFTPLVLDAATGRSREWITVIQPGLNGTTWVATRDDGFYELGRRRWPVRFDGLIVNPRGEPLGLGPGLHRIREGELQRLRQGLSPADPSWSGLLELPGNGLLAAAAQGLFLFRDLAAPPLPLLPPDAPSGRVLAVAAARRGGYWLGTTTGLYHARLEANSLASLTPVAGVRGPVVSIVDDRDGALWAATWGFGLFRIVDGRAEAFTIDHGLPDNFVHVLYEDREANLWIGTRAGLSRWKSTPIIPFGTTEGLGGQFLSSLSGDAQGNIWMGTWRSGLYRVRDGRPERVPLPQPDLRVLVRATASAPDGTLWMSDWGTLYCRRGTNWIRWTPPVPGTTPQVNALLFDSQGRLWIGADAGLYEQRETQTLVHLAGHDIRALHQDSRGRIWAGGPTGLWRIDSGAAPVPIPGLPHPTVTSISEDTAGRIWATTRANGIALVTATGIRALDQRHGLPALPLYAAVDDGRGSLWLSSPAGIFEVQQTLLAELIGGSRTRIPVIAYGQDDGMRTIECQNVGHPSAWKDPAGDIWFPTVRGAVRVRPRARQLPAPPAVLVEGTATVRQSHTVTFTAARLGAPSRIEFRYRLQDRQTEWTYLGPERTLRYDSLPAGTHTLLLAARERGGDWGPPATVTLTQAPRWHETWAFRLLVAASLAALLYLLYRWRMYILRTRYAAVLVERNRIAQEWHDTLLAGFSAISWQLDVALQRLKQKPESAAATVETARTMVHHYRAEARRVIWDLRHDAPEPTSLDIAIRAAIEQLTGDRGIASHVAVEGDSRPMPGDLAQNLLRICQEAAANAVSHGQPSRIDVTLHYDAAAVAVTVRDDGRGFDPRAVSPGHFGLDIMRERARRFGGELHVASTAGAGTVIRAAIPLPAAAEGAS